MDLISKYNQQVNNLKFSIPIHIYTDKEYCVYRRKIILLIANILEKNKKFKLLNKNIQNEIIINIENSCYIETIKKSEELLIYKSWKNEKFCYLYQLYCNKVTKNLDIESEVKSNYLINIIIDNKIDIKNIAGLSSDILCPEKSEKIKENINIRSNQTIKSKTSSLYRCPNCGKKETKLKHFQGRALDEAMTTSLTCVFCNYNWVS